jgi:hypothetical protein
MFIIVIISKSHTHSKDFNALLFFAWTQRMGIPDTQWSLCWMFRTIYGVYEPSGNRVVVPARQPTWNGGIDYLESIPGLLKSLWTLEVPRDSRTVHILLLFTARTVTYIYLLYSTLPHLPPLRFNYVMLRSN